MSEESLRKCIRSLLLREEMIHLHRWEEPEKRYTVDQDSWNDLISTGRAKEENLPDPVDLVVNTFDSDDPRREGIRKALDDPGIREETRWEIARALAPHWRDFKDSARTFDLGEIAGKLPDWADSVAKVRQSRVGKGGNEIGPGEFAALLMLADAMMDPEASGRVDVRLPGNVNVHVKSTVRETHAGVTFYNVRSMPDEYFEPLGEDLYRKIRDEGVPEDPARELSDWVWSSVRRRHKSGQQGAPPNFNGTNLASRMDRLGIHEPKVWDLISQGLNEVGKRMVDSGGQGYVLLFAPDGAHLYPSEDFYYARTAQTKDGTLEMSPPKMSESLRLLRHLRDLLKRWDGMKDAHVKRALAGENPDSLAKELQVDLEHWDFKDLKILAREVANSDREAAEEMKKIKRLQRPGAIRVILANFRSAVSSVPVQEPEEEEA